MRRWEEGGCKPFIFHCKQVFPMWSHHLKLNCEKWIQIWLRTVLTTNVTISKNYHVSYLKVIVWLNIHWATNYWHSMTLVNYSQTNRVSNWSVTHMRIIWVIVRCKVKCLTCDPCGLVKGLIILVQTNVDWSIAVEYLSDYI